MGYETTAAQAIGLNIEVDESQIERALHWFELYFGDLEEGKRSYGGTLGCEILDVYYDLSRACLGRDQSAAI